MQAGIGLRERTQQLRHISSALRGRNLIWFGTRGEDARPLCAIPEFSHCFSRLAPLGTGKLQADECLETIAGVRIDHNTYDAEAGGLPEEATLRARLLAACDSAAAIIAYKSEPLLSEVSFVKDARLLAMFHEQQSIFDHKPWVETELAGAGVRVLPWRYLSDDDPRRFDILSRALRVGPLVLRANRSRGGAGLRIVREPPALHDEGAATAGFTAYAPYLAQGIPLNVSGCIFADGSVTLHAPSIQLIGIAACTNRILGYCGNDFASVGRLDAGVLDAFEAMTVRTGAWLRSQGYLGNFGIDALVDGRDVYLVEVNARFQGSSALGARLSEEMGLPDVYTDHLAALLGLEAKARGPLRQLATGQRALAQIIAYNRSRANVRCTGDGAGSGFELRLLPAANVSVLPNATLFKVVLPGPVTRDGLNLDTGAETWVSKLAESLFEPAEDSLRSSR
jgi:hypothetical protein